MSLPRIYKCSICGEDVDNNINLETVSAKQGDIEVSISVYGCHSQLPEVNVNICKNCLAKIIKKWGE